MNKSRDDSGEGGFLGRWSRRKLADQRGELADEQGPDLPVSDTGDGLAAGDTANDPDDALQADQEADQQLTEEDVEQLGPESDFKPFLKSSVPLHVRRLALRKLWRSSPVLANLDGLNDYDGDFTNAATDAVNVASSWSAGRGYKTLEDIGEKLTGEMETDAAPEQVAATATGDEPDIAGEQAEHDAADARPQDPSHEPKAGPV